MTRCMKNDGVQGGGGVREGNLTYIGSAHMLVLHTGGRNVLSVVFEQRNGSWKLFQGTAVWKTENHDQCNAFKIFNQ